MRNKTAGCLRCEKGRWPIDLSRGNTFGRRYRLIRTFGHTLPPLTDNLWEKSQRGTPPLGECLLSGKFEKRGGQAHGV